MPEVRHPRHATGLWALVIAVGFAFVGGCDSGEQPADSAKNETTVKAQQNMADFMKNQQPKSKTTKR